MVCPQYVRPGWFCQLGLSRNATAVIHNLADIASNNGNLLLNAGLKPDGTLLGEQRQVLVETGRWLRQNGEAIYGTRPWEIFGEGPTRATGGHFKPRTHPFIAADMRFTRKVARCTRSYSVPHPVAASGKADLVWRRSRADGCAARCEPAARMGARRRGAAGRLPETAPGAHAWVIVMAA
jgi:hypothetical protein